MYVISTENLLNVRVSSNSQNYLV